MRPLKMLVEETDPHQQAWRALAASPERALLDRIVCWSSEVISTCARRFTFNQFGSTTALSRESPEVLPRVLLEVVPIRTDVVVYDVNVIVLLLFIGSWLLRRDAPELPGTLAYILSFAGAGLSLVTGWLGGELVDRLGVGVDEGASLNASNSLFKGSTKDRRRQAPILIPLSHMR